MRMAICCSVHTARIVGADPGPAPIVGSGGIKSGGIPIALKLKSSGIGAGWRMSRGYDCTERWMTDRRDLASALLDVDEQRREMIKVLRKVENWNADHEVGWVPTPLQDLARELLNGIEMCQQCGREPQLLGGRCAGCGVLP